MAHDASVWLEKIPFFAVTLVMMAVAVHARQSLLATKIYPLSFRIAQACYGFVFYLYKTLLPIGITAFYPFPLHASWAEPRFVLGAAFVVGLSVAAFLLRRRMPALAAAWAAYLLILAPSSGLVPMGRALAADRYSYLAMMVWVAPVASRCIDVVQPRKTRLKAARDDRAPSLAPY